MNEICRTNIFDSIQIVNYWRYFGNHYEFYIAIESENPFQDSWDKKLFERKFPPDSEDFNYCFEIHNKVLKYLRRKLRKANSRLLRKTRFRKIYLAQKGKCYLCGDALRAIDCTIEHVHPVSKGGNKEKNNLLLAHKKCNNEKADRTPTDEEIRYLANVNELVKKIKDETLI